MVNAGPRILHGNEFRCCGLIEEGGHPNCPACGPVIIDELGRTGKPRKPDNMQFSLHLTLLLAGSVAAQRPSVKLSDATYVGTTTQIAVATGTATVDKYVGVRFAAPPVRFRAAKPPVAGSGTVEATKSPAACPQSCKSNRPCWRA